MDAHTFLDNFGTVADAPGGVQRLRVLVLDLALRGRLVEQECVGEPVAALLRRLDSARTKSIASNGWGVARSAGPIKLSEQPWAVPDSWAWVRLEALALPQAGFAFKSSHFNQSERGTPLIRIRDIGNNSTECHYDGEFRSEFLVEPGDYLVGMDGNFNIRRWAGPSALLNQRVTRLLFFSNEIERSFVTWALQDRINAVHGSRAYTTVQHLSGRQIGAAVIPLPAIPEQKSIVTRVDQLMGLCDELEARQERCHSATTRFRGSALRALTAAATPDDLRIAWDRVTTHWPALTGYPDSIPGVRKAVLQLLVAGGLTHQDPHDEPSECLLERTVADRDELVGRRLTRIVADDPTYARADALPSGWSWAALQDVVRFIDYRGRTPTKTSAGVPLITAKNIRRGFVSETPREYIAEREFSRWMSRGLPRCGDVLFTTEAPMGNGDDPHA